MNLLFYVVSNFLWRHAVRGGAHDTDSNFLAPTGPGFLSVSVWLFQSHGRTRRGLSRNGRSFADRADKALNKDEWQAGVKQLSEVAEKSELAAVAVRLGGKGNISDTHVAWKQTTAVPEVPSLLYHDGRVYLHSEKGVLTCREATSGKELYKQRLGVEGTCYASPVVGDGKIYVGSDGGTVIVFEPGDRYRRLARIDFDEGILATPALVDGRIYLRTLGHLYAFGLPLP